MTAVQLTYARHGDLEILVPSTYGGELATAKARATGNATRWTKTSFLDAIGTPDDQSRATTLFDLQEAFDDRRGTKDDYWFGLRPAAVSSSIPTDFATRRSTCGSIVLAPSCAPDCGQTTTRSCTTLGSPNWLSS